MADTAGTLRAASHAELSSVPSRRAVSKRLLKRAQSLVERAFDVKILRASVAASLRYSDPALAGLRRWESTDVVFDVGANDGRTILRIRDLLNRPRIYAFEPVAATFQTLVERTSGMSGVTSFQLALGAAPGRSEIYVSSLASMSSLLPDWTVPSRVETVDVSTVDAVMEAQGIPFIHFLKVDTEGLELEVLRGAERALQDARIAIVQLEVGFDQMGGRRFVSLEEARQHLAPRGYVLYGIYNQCRTRGRAPADWPEEARSHFDARGLAFCDALFVRADLTQ